MLKIFGHENEAAEDIVYINWLNMCRAGLMGLEFYSEERGVFRQAHMWARYVILSVLLEAGDGFVAIEETTTDGEPDLIVHLDRTKIRTVGLAAIGAFLRELQVHKSCADIERGSALWAKYSVVDEKMRQYRHIVLARKKPRAIYVQPHLHRAEDGSVALKEFPATFTGIAESFIARYAEMPHLAKLAADEKAFVDDSA